MTCSSAPISLVVPSETISSGQDQPPLAQAGQEVGPGVGGLGAGRLKPDEDRFALGGGVQVAITGSVAAPTLSTMRSTQP
jgi:hypothetical protein